MKSKQFNMPEWIYGNNEAFVNTACDGIIFDCFVEVWNFEVMLVSAASEGLLKGFYEV